jgi:hypothetical protein
VLFPTALNKFQRLIFFFISSFWWRIATDEEFPVGEGLMG